MKGKRWFSQCTAAVMCFFLSVTLILPVSAKVLPGSVKQGTAIQLPAYLQELAEKKEIEVACTAKREDLGIERSCAPVEVDNYAELLAGLQLKKASKGGTVAVKAPFTLRFTYGTQTDTFAFTTKGVRYNNNLYLPGNPDALNAFYEEDRQKFFSAKYEKLGKELDFTAAQIAGVVIQKSSYFDVVSMQLTEKGTMAALLEEQKALQVRTLKQDEQINPDTGGTAYEIKYTLTDGTEIHLSINGTMAGLQKGGQTVSSYQILQGENTQQLDAVFNSYRGVPALSAALNGEQLEQLYQTAFQFGQETKESQREIPIEHRFDQHSYLPVRSDNTAKLTFSEAPSKVTAQLFQIEEVEGEEKKASIQQAPVSADGAVKLPGEPGDYGVTVHAAFPKGTADYFFGFTVSDLPDFFDSINYGNESGAVTVTRDDLGRAVTGGQNRQYVEFLQSLDLVPAGDAAPWPPSQIKKPFTLTFRCEGYPDQLFQFRTTDSKILYNGKEYRARDNSAIGKLYAASEPMSGDNLLDDTKGFLTAELTTFGALYPLRTQDIGTIQITEKRQYRRSVSSDDQGKLTYAFHEDILSAKQVEPGDFSEALKKINSILLAKEETNADAYDFGNYTAYEVTMKDGKSFLLDRRLLIDGKSSGYYIIAE